MGEGPNFAHSQSSVSDHELHWDKTEPKAANKAEGGPEIILKVGLITSLESHSQSSRRGAQRRGRHLPRGTPVCGLLFASIRP